MLKRMTAAVLAAGAILSACDRMTNPDAAPVRRPAPAPAASVLALPGAVKPVSALRDYDGTYGGAPGTGTVGYSTLWRDNYDGGATSGCNGEGCGKHPGVDIPVPSGTSVYAALGGRVAISRCGTDGWGGLVVIEAASLYNSAETVYLVYGHLRTRYVNAGDYVGSGATIGLSGGAPADVCHGNSTGAHLHFQVDRYDGNPEPYFPASVNPGDGDFGVANRTYNPVPFVTGGYHWSFSQASNYELWTAANISSSGVSGDALWIDGNNDPWIWRDGNVACAGYARPCSATIAAEAANYRYVKLDMYNNCVSNPLKIYFRTSLSPAWDEAKSVEYWLPSPGAYTGTVYMGGNPQWSGLVTGVRIDPAQSCAAGVSDPDYFGYITLQSSAS